MRHHLREYILPPRAGRGWVARWVASSISRSTKQSFLIDKVRKNEDCHLQVQLLFQGTSAEVRLNHACYENHISVCHGASSNIAAIQHYWVARWVART